jgi:preprotein translocase subunit SecD
LARKGEPKEFIIRLAHNQTSRVSYDWVELGPSERWALALHNAAQNDPRLKTIWKQAAFARGQAKSLTDFARDVGGKSKLLQGALFFSRQCRNRNLPERERQKKAVDYFVLARNPEIDDGVILPRGSPKAITGKHLVSAQRALDHQARPCIHVSFNDIGGRLFKDLTLKNTPSVLPGATPSSRHLAIIVNGLLVSAPTIDSPIERSALITGNFRTSDVDQLVRLLRSNVTK